MLASRIMWAVDKGSAAVDLDSADGPANRGRRWLTAGNQPGVFQFWSGASHWDAPAIGLKNDLCEGKQLVDAFDLAIDGRSVQSEECGRSQPSWRRTSRCSSESTDSGAGFRDSSGRRRRPTPIHRFAGNRDYPQPLRIRRAQVRGIRAAPPVFLSPDTPQTTPHSCRRNPLRMPADRRTRMDMAGTCARVQRNAAMGHLNAGRGSASAASRANRACSARGFQPRAWAGPSP